MSNLAHGDEDYPAAAEKHLNDASALFTAGRYDGCGYLCGYVVECTLKTLVVLDVLAKAGLITFAALKGGAMPATSDLGSALKHAKDTYRHRLDQLGATLLAFAALPGASTAKYTPPIDPNMYGPPNGWTEHIRYRAPSFSQKTASDWLTHAKLVYQTTVVQLQLDGVLR